jgi:hypothetical protein
MMATDAEDDPIERGLEQGVAAVAGGLKRGLSGAKRALDGPEGAAVESLIDDTDLPELAGGDALSALALRLDRESDLLRSLGLRQLARVAWADRIALTVAIVTLIAGGALAATAILGTLASAEHSGRATLVVAAAFTLVACATLVWIVARSGARRAGELAREAFAKARESELRLERVAVLLAIRAADPKGYKAALARFEPLRSDEP